MKFASLFLVLGAASLSFAAPAKPKAKPKAVPKSNAAPKPKASKWVGATAAQRAFATASIRGQLEAFKKDDWEKAATYQSEGLRRMFGTTARFRAAIENNYPQFADYVSIGFDRSLALGGVVQIAVHLKGRDGVQVRAIYTMVKEKGIYKVAGVQGGAALTPDPGSSSV